MNKWIIGPLLVAALVVGQGCKKDETAGEKLDKAMQDTKDATKKAADKTADAAKDAANKAKDATK